MKVNENVELLSPCWRKSNSICTYFDTHSVEICAYDWTDKENCEFEDPKHQAILRGHTSFLLSLVGVEWGLKNHDILVPILLYSLLLWNDKLDIYASEKRYLEECILFSLPTELTYEGLKRITDHVHDVQGGHMKLEKQLPLSGRLMSRAISRNERSLW